LTVLQFQVFKYYVNVELVQLLNFLFVIQVIVVENCIKLLMVLSILNEQK